MQNLPTMPSLLLATALNRISRGMFDDTFAGIHQLSWFDWAILIPYFGILAATLDLRDVSASKRSRTYFKYRKNATQEPAQKFPAIAARYNPASSL